MTDDVTRGLKLLADEAEAASVDTDAVITAATALSRNRAILTTALATLVVLCALVVTLGAVKAPPPIADKPDTRHPPVLGTEVAKLPTPEEQDRRRTSLHNMIIKAFGRILPDGWKPSTFDFACEQTHCWAEGEIHDAAGPINIGFYVQGDYGTSSCYQPECTKRLLEDGTIVTFSKGKGSLPSPGSEPEMRVSVGAVRPDGTSLSMYASWPASRTAPVLTDDQWREFATAFTF